ncbi:FecR family protein [Candidatus Magnetominusculus xianensis]|uniref:FecR protein n=1 Tax=Candidatus Magnetominusculus xianensis TaxID=1748249 RepID=A0ABR5SF61_9BACT|nr:FecR family protein [Candidatus Magnetominusculus xianensis]KWT75272.1 FecR protein [Candidatus Magnetominusculus xianensis]MBF0403794.1 FecR domain-containing protein [Nitrospirota bacterium]
MIRKRLSIYIALVLSVLLISTVVYAEAEIGKVTFVEGKADILRGGNLPAKPLQLNDPVFEKDTIRTKAASKLEISFKDGNVLRLAQSTRIDISEYISDNTQSKSTVKLPRGHVRAVVDKDIAKRIADAPAANRFEVHTPNVVAGVRGSDGDIMFEPASGDTIVAIREGVFYVYNLRFPDKSTDITAGNMVVIPQSAPPGQQRPISNTETQRNEKATDPGKKDTGQSDTKSSVTPGTTAPVSAAAPVREAAQTLVADSTVKNVITSSNIISPDTNVYQPPVTQYDTSPLTSPATPAPTTAPTPAPTPAPAPVPTPTPAKTYDFGGTITASEFAAYLGYSNSFSKSGTITGSITSGTYSGANTPFSFTAAGLATPPDGFPLWAFSVGSSSANSYINMNAVAGGVSTSVGTIGTIVGKYTNSFDNTQGYVVTYSQSDGSLFYPVTSSIYGNAVWSASGQIVAVPIDPNHGIYGYDAYYYGFNNITSPGSRIDYSNDKYFSITSWNSNGLVYGTSYGTAAVGNVPVISVGTAMGYYTNGILQLTDIYKYMAASQYLYLACGDETGAAGCSKTTPVTSLTYLNIPSVEIGRTNLSGSLISGADYVNLNMNNVVFFAPSSGSKPSIFAIGNITGTYSLGTNLTATSLLSTSNQIYLSDFTKNGISIYFNFGMWSGGKWNGTIGPSFTTGALSGGNLTGSSWSGTVIMNGWAGGLFNGGIISGNGIGIIR